MRVRDAAGGGVEVIFDNPASPMKSTTVTITFTQELFDVEGESKGVARIHLRGEVNGAVVSFGEPDIEIPPRARDEEAWLRQFADDFVDVLVRAEVN